MNGTTSQSQKSRLENRPYFIKMAALCFGSLSAAGMFWIFGGLGGPGWWCFLALLVAGVAYVWAYLMWFVFKGIYGIKE